MEETVENEANMGEDGTNYKNDDDNYDEIIDDTSCTNKNTFEDYINKIILIEKKLQEKVQIKKQQ